MAIISWTFLFSSIGKNGTRIISMVDRERKNNIDEVNNVFGKVSNNIKQNNTLKKPKIKKQILKISWLCDFFTPRLLIQKVKTE